MAEHLEAVQIPWYWWRARDLSTGRCHKYVPCKSGDEVTKKLVIMVSILLPVFLLSLALFFLLPPMNFFLLLAEFFLPPILGVLFQAFLVHVQYVVQQWGQPRGWNSGGLSRRGWRRKVVLRYGCLLASPACSLSFLVLARRRGVLIGYYRKIQKYRRKSGHRNGSSTEGEQSDVRVLLSQAGMWRAQCLARVR